MQKEQILYLLKQYYQQQLTDAEWIELEHLLSTVDPMVLEEAFADFIAFYSDDSTEVTTQAVSEQRIERILSLDRRISPSSGREIPVRQIHPVLKKWAWSAAAVCLLFLGLYWYTHDRDLSPDESNSFTSIVNDIQPGGEGGRLHLGNGEEINLDTILGTPQIKLMGEGAYVKYDRSSATYVIAQELRSAAPLYHTVETPNGRRYRLRLSDGTQVWLNAGSKLTFPIAFSGQSRDVFVTGEAYFEVSKDSHRPFSVNVIGSSTKVQVLGTKFNISSYPEDKGFVTTLFEGKVKLVNSTQSKVLKPGDRAVAGVAGEIIVNPSENLKEEVAWKDNYFAFTDADIRTVMLELGRWYDLQVNYEGPMPTGKFSGKIGKELNFGQAMEILGGTDIKYKIDNHRNVTIITNH
ncbi:FecR family protein [Sphingobacterium sp. SYP-B4668]|uniref:FecR family protein n=1 Tax=Sphingobacterium sp. SYP-B4668 TaxID=2996035 RepID=UPI0022DDD11C|nr:FecR family protein [Sphingobacterium sp. SYP-B4668]